MTFRGLILPQKGQPQCNAGVVIMGYPGDPLYNAGAQARPAWTRDGSLMVFRKLKQMVPEFRKYVKDAGPKWREWMPPEEVEDMKKLNPPFADSEGAALYGARLFGRWQSVRASFQRQTLRVSMIKLVIGRSNSKGSVSR